MTLLKRFHVGGTTVSLLESDSDLTIEISPEYKKNREKIISYLHDEGILEEILAGNTNWEHKK
jgi:hypothetical protein